MTAKTLSVHDFGATGRGLRRDTAAIQRAIDAGAADGCEVIIPQGTWLTGALFLRTGSRLRLAAGATLLGATDIADYPEIFSRIAGVEMRWPAAILNAIDVSGVEITGSGTIDGQGPHWWNLYWGENQSGGLRREYDEQGLRWIADYLIKRPRACLLHNVRGARVADITFRRSGFWNLQITYCEDVLVSGVTIRDNHGPSTDGIDIDSSRRVRVTGCDIVCGDDGIAVKSGRDGDGLRVNRPSEAIEIDRCVIRSGYGVTLGSEVSGGIRNVHIHDIDFDGAACGLRMKSARERGGVIENVRAENLRMRNVQFPFSWIMDWHNAYNRKRINNPDALPESWRAVASRVPEAMEMTRVRNIAVSGVEATLSEDYALPARAFDLVAFPERPMQNVSFSDCRIAAGEFGRIVAVEGMNFSNVQVSVSGNNDAGNDTFDNR